MTSFNLYEAYAAVYDENLREDILAVEEDFSFIDDLSDNELVQVMEEILYEREVTLDECFDAFDAELISEETEMQRMNRLQNKATREKKAAAATAGRMKSAERERVGRKHAMKRLQVATTRAGKNLADKAKTTAAGVASAASAGASEAGRRAKAGAEKVGGKLAAAKEKIKGFIKSGRKAVAGGLRGLASKVEPKEATGKEVKSAAKETLSRRAAASAKAAKAAAGTKGTSVVQGQPAGTFKSKKSRSEAQKREARLTSESYEILASYILEDLVNEGYAETFEEAFEVLESFSDYEVGEIAENYLVEDTVDLYDVVLEHLLDEGYADTEEAATVIMANMSEEWREEILDERNRGERGMIDAEVRMRRDRRDGDTTTGGFKPYVRAGGSQRAEHEASRGKKKIRGQVTASMRGPNYH
jgi:hypothetical protein